DLDPHDALAGDRGLDTERARGEREREVVVERLDAREEDARRDLQLVPRHDGSGRDLDDLGGDIEVRQRLFDDLGALADLAAGPGVTGVAEAKNVERRQGPGPVGLGVEHAFDGDVLVWQPGDRGSERALWSRGRLVRLRRWKEPQSWFGRLSGRLGALDGHVDPERRGGGPRLLVFGLLHVDAPSEAACRAARQADTRPQCAAALPGGSDQVAEGTVRGDHDPDEQKRDERDGAADIAEGAGRDVLDAGADDTA